MTSPEGGDDIEELLDDLRFILRPEPWRERALCRIEQVPTSEFFPVRGESQRIARECCARCPVAIECRDYADRSNTEWGIWGGEIRKRGPWQFLDDDYWFDIKDSIPKPVDYDLD